jgi:antitoxin (DNA-binding transcriptional repressor) of toxin-antitoxin stability system
MKTVAIDELRKRLGAYLRQVATGEVLRVTVRGRVVAELRQPSPATQRASHDPSVHWPSPALGAIATVDLLEAERGER